METDTTDSDGEAQPVDRPGTLVGEAAAMNEYVDATEFAHEAEGTTGAIVWYISSSTHNTKAAAGRTIRAHGGSGEHIELSVDDNDANFVICSNDHPRRSGGEVLREATRLGHFVAAVVADPDSVTREHLYNSRWDE